MLFMGYKGMKRTGNIDLTTSLEPNHMYEEKTYHSI